VPRRLGVRVVVAAARVAGRHDDAGSAAALLLAVVASSAPSKLPAACTAQATAFDAASTTIAVPVAAASLRGRKRADLVRGEAVQVLQGRPSSKVRVDVRRVYLHWRSASTTIASSIAAASLRGRKRADLVRGEEPVPVLQERPEKKVPADVWRVRLHRCSTGASVAAGASRLAIHTAASSIAATTALAATAGFPPAARAGSLRDLHRRLQGCRQRDP